MARASDRAGYRHKLSNRNSTNQNLTTKILCPVQVTDYYLACQGAISVIDSRKSDRVKQDIVSVRSKDTYSES